MQVINRKGRPQGNCTWPGRMGGIRISRKERIGGKRRKKQHK